MLALLSSVSIRVVVVLVATDLVGAGVAALLWHGTTLRMLARRDRVAQRCAAGREMEYREYADRDHMPLVQDDSPPTGDLVQWANERLEGRVPANTWP